MPPKKDSTIAAARGDGRGQFGPRGGFRTDSAISNNRPGMERTLQPWVPDSTDGLDGSLESSSHGGPWDQFAENERRFGLKTDYDENIYTTTIDKSHPQYRERMAAAERKAREIESSLATTAHVAEERVMDHVAGEDRGGDEEDKYSGVRRTDFPPLSSRENKYTPPAKRAPSAQATVTGAPVDPAIISSQVRAPNKRQSPVKQEDGTIQSQTQKQGSIKSPETPQSAHQPARQDGINSPQPSHTNAKTSAAKQPEPKASEKSSSTALRPSATATRTASPQVKDSAPSAALTVERDVLNSFKSFASQQRQNADKIRTSKAKADKEVKLTELKKFAQGFKLSTPVPTDLISIIAKDPAKQKEIQAKALQNVEDVARIKVAEPPAPVKQKDTGGKEPPNKPNATSGSSTSQATTDSRGSTRNPPPQFSNSPGPGPGPANRHPNARQSYGPISHHNSPYRNDRPAQHNSQQNRQPLGQRLRNVEQQKLSQPPNQHQHAGPAEVRIPPTGPANAATDGSYGRRLSGVSGHTGAKLNPNSHEFRPNPFASTFNPNGSHPSAASSPRSAAVNNTGDSTPNPSPVGQLLRRKTKAIDVKKCFVLAQIKTCQPPQGRNWDENGGLRPSYDTLPTWRQFQEEAEKPDSTMRLTYKEFLEQQSFVTPASAPNPPQVSSSVPHHYQLPLHLQQGAHAAASRQSPNMPSMPLHGQHGHAPQVSFNGGDDHRMMHSNSAQSFASPRMGQVSMSYAPGVNSPAQMPYSQPVMQPFASPGIPQLGQFRSFSNSHQPYMQQQPGHMTAPMMMQPHFVGPQGMVPSPQMPMYGTHAQFAPPNGTPPQPMPGSNGYPSPGRPSAPMMAHQGSQQGQAVYGMSPNVQYQQPVFSPHQPGGQGGNVRGLSAHGPQQFGTSPQQMHTYGPQHRNGNNNYGAKNFGGSNQQQNTQQSGSQTRASDGSTEVN